MSDLAFVTDGTFGVLFILAGIIDAGVNHCGNEGCLARNDVQAYNSLSIGTTTFQEGDVGEEIYFRRDTGIASGPFQWIYGASATSDGELWAGAGQAITYSTRNDRYYTQIHAMAGLYEQGGGVDLGGPVAFRTGIEFGYQNRAGTRMAISFDHRSNAGIYNLNPGLETVQFRVSIPTK